MMLVVLVARCFSSSIESEEGETREDVESEKGETEIFSSDGASLRASSDLFARGPKVNLLKGLATSRTCEASVWVKPVCDLTRKINSFLPIFFLWLFMEELWRVLVGILAMVNG